ncbi:hypothetical protein OPQ81_002616 [Rhizoctonia solani]|nr:hypothetical protein OPQ81_002616 [Rhizoctonia solani]
MRVDESQMLKIKFQENLSVCPQLKESTWQSLSYCIATCWNSDHQALDDYLYLWQPVKALTNDPGLNLHHLALKTTQLQLVAEINEALEVFELPTQHFPSGSVLLVHQVLLALVELKDALTKMWNSDEVNLVTHIGAQAALNVFDKYMENMSICKVYFISLVMCPDVKLGWFYRHYSAESVMAIHQMILARFQINYPVSSDTITMGSQSPEPPSRPQNHWLQGHSFVSPIGINNPPFASADLDLIEAYFASPVEPIAIYGVLLSIGLPGQTQPHV